MEITVKLKQHTPMIHFQWYQSGATLRATELKPKLDRFLKEKNINSIKDYFGEKGNLPYKLVVTATNKDTSVVEIEKVKKDRDGKVKRETIPTFFGNIRATEEENANETKGKKPVPYKFVLYNNVELKFISFIPKIIEEIKKNLPEFLFVTNFGARQSKGFGSFYIDPSEQLYKDPKDFAKYYFTLNTTKNELYEKYKELFEYIDLFYRTLRSGINIKDRFYFKSIMFLYAKSMNWTWDKKAIKEKFISKEELKRQKGEHNHPDVLTFKGEKEYLVRDLLGVASFQAYKSYNFDLQYDKGNEIERFKSPITFKPILSEDKDSTKFTVYLILNPIPDDIFDKEFKINKTRGHLELDSITLRTPPQGKFDIEKYLESALATNICRHVDKKFQNDWRFKVIKCIYSQLKAQLKRGVGNDGK